MKLTTLPYRAFVWISESLGGLALALTAIGIYGVITSLVTHRSKEIGIRIAVGAFIAFGVRKLVSSQFSILRIFDLRVYAVSIAIVLVAAAFAAAIPARRASKLDAMTVLRRERRGCFPFYIFGA
jgi:ABC-type antimicrobial peptide transport system permease subunit